MSSPWAGEAVQLTFLGDTVIRARFVLGGVARAPWRAHAAEVFLPNVILTRGPVPSYTKVAPAALLMLVSRFSASYTRL